MKFVIVLAALIAIVAADVSELSVDAQITTKLGKDGYEYPVPEAPVVLEVETEAPAPVEEAVEVVEEAVRVDEDPSQEYLPPVEYLPPADN